MVDVIDVIEPVVDAVDVVDVVEPGLYVADDIALTSKKGVLTRESGVLKPEFFTGGQATIDKLIESGHVVKTGS